ncbi:uncharacterized protein E0L32_008984 [Thyridium curvatum]|uniref:Filamentation protein n=1 Tax=Thyridium curvatum TaxID=1093900 RepID=A0A507APU6_9PEZI|nr:uncharacterized protein E0L32_008984 [Thyridium curvatum]TPX09793.1 hypothetical protein E0L32_008984 [Thyridium curvatum]
MKHDPAKAAQYISQLDAARCNGNWEAVPELVRKIKKHAPERACLVLTAETEVAIEKATRNLPVAEKSSPAITAKDLDASSLLPKLLSAVDGETDHLEDRFQAQVCVGWLHWVVGEYSLAAVRLPKGFEQDNTLTENPEKVSEWTRVCAMKSAYLRANCLARNGQRQEALAVFEEGLPALSSTWGGPQAKTQPRYWSELFLTEFCMLSSRTVELEETSLEDANCLAGYRSWAKYWEASKGASLPGGYGFRGSVARRRIWFEYYSALSTILQSDLPFPTGHVPKISNDSSARNQLRIELKKVEAAYEALLLKETEFPRADEEREEVEIFTNLVVKNWTILSGRGWIDQDLGQGGKETLSRGVLDILYRASMKTYHSTSILRHLFIVHLSVAEFDLAFKAFDSYLSLVKKGKARVAKTGHQEPSLDDDATLIETISTCINALCRYGDRQAAEKARELSIELEQTLHKLSAKPGSHSPAMDEGSIPLTNSGQSFPPRVEALAWQALGLAHAQWARVTYESSTRVDIRSKAISCLRKSLSPEYGLVADLRSMFALAVLLAEQRELTTAIELVKTTLLANKSPTEGLEIYHGRYWKERALIPLWHLLSLLLSARQDYIMAARACEGALEQFKDPTILFGTEQLYRSDHLNEAEEMNGKVHEGSRGVVDDMDDYEKEGILEVKMTQLALLEVMEGPTTAVNASLELLSLFNRLFGDLQPRAALAAPKTTEVPKSSAGTLRSIKGSIFGRSSEKSGRPGTRRTSIMSNNEKPGQGVSRPTTMQTVASTQAPTIQITRENGTRDEPARARTSAGTNDRRSQSHKRSSLRKRDSSGHRRRASSIGAVPHQPTVVDGENYFTPVGDSYQGLDFFQFANRRQASSGGPPVSMKRHLSHMDSYTSSRSRTSDGGEVSVESVESTSNLLPLVQFSKEHHRRRRGAILVKVWLMIARFYRKAEMHDDATKAVIEAQKLVQTLETEITKESPDSAALRRIGWGGKKCVDELWGDVLAEMGQLSLARDAVFVARGEFETALTHFPDHPKAIVGLSNVLLDIYCENVLPPPVIPPMKLADGSAPTMHTSESLIPNPEVVRRPKKAVQSPFPTAPLGLNKTQSGDSKEGNKDALFNDEDGEWTTGKPKSTSELPPPYKATSFPAMDRLAARDRAHALLSGLTKLGTGWNYSEAWFALARAYEESDQLDKAKEVLWWCVELEEGMAVREWECVGTSGYVL